MDAVFIRPAKVEIFTVSDDNANGLAVVVVVAVEHIVVRSALIVHRASDGFSGAAEAHEHDAAFVRCEGVQRVWRVLEEALKHIQLIPLNFIQGRKTAKVFVQETELLMYDDRLCIRCVFP